MVMTFKEYRAYRLKYFGEYFVTRAQYDAYVREEKLAQEWMDRAEYRASKRLGF